MVVLKLVNCKTSIQVLARIGVKYPFHIIIIILTVKLAEATLDAVVELAICERLPPIGLLTVDCLLT